MDHVAPCCCLTVVRKIIRAVQFCIFESRPQIKYNKNHCKMQTSKPSQLINTAIALAFCIIAPTIGYIKIGLPPVIIVGGSAIIGFFFWYFTYLKQPTDPKIILPLFILTVAGLQIHIVEEYLTGFGPAMSRLFNIPWSEKGFLMVFALVGQPFIR